ncbi:MAG: hypothetical protein H0W44_07995 [Gammaproteobacteria bacterium]|nr:hypothetical protein [Gammaproteobacteria bacterium]
MWKPSCYALALSILSVCAFTPLAFAAKLPTRGIEKMAVEQQFGGPLSVEGPVGQPPITRWIYNEFEVVFEYDHVVHSFIRVLDNRNVSLPVNNTSSGLALPPAQPANSSTSAPAVAAPVDNAVPVPFDESTNALSNEGSMNDTATENPAPANSDAMQEDMPSGFESFENTPSLRR